jgi:hypothetical protein
VSNEDDAPLVAFDFTDVECVKDICEQLAATEAEMGMTHEQALEFVRGAIETKIVTRWLSLYAAILDHERWAKEEP